MTVRSPFAGFLANLFPEVSPQLRALYESAADNAGLLRTDFYTIRDLLDLAGYRGEEPLHVLLLCLLLALDEGSLCVAASAAGLGRRLTGLVPPSEAEAWALAAASALSHYPQLIGTQVTEGKPLVLHRQGERCWLFFQRYLKHELLLQAQLRQRLGQAAVIPSAAALRPVFEQVLVREPLLLAGRPVQLNRDQRLAVALALVKNFTIISGGPGTGKTSIVFTLLRCLVRSGVPADEIALAAPTGRAAQRLTDALRGGLENLQPLRADSPDAPLRRLNASTLHHLLGYQPTRGTFRQHAENPLPYRVVIVDEVSMVGLFLMAQLLQATAPETRLILLGDKDQLPSVEAGAVLASLVPSGVQPVYSEPVRTALAELWPDCGALPIGKPQPLEDVLVILEENYRSQRDILEVAGRVNRQESACVEQLRCLSLPPLGAENLLAALEKQPGCWLLEQDTLDLPRWRQVLEAWLEQHFLTATSAGETYRSLAERLALADRETVADDQRAALDRLFGLLNRARVLTLVREGPYGCVGISQFLEQQLRLRLDRPARGAFFLGGPVLVTRNDAGRQLYNGDVGIALRSQGGAYRVVFPRQGGYVSFPAEALPARESAFALTVHKSQ